MIMNRATHQAGGSKKKVFQVGLISKSKKQKLFDPAWCYYVFVFSYV